MPTPIERVLARCEAEGDCLVWQGCLSKGYGILQVDNRPLRVHRIAYVEAHGPIPEGMAVDHICHETRCVNPQHLRAVTTKQNGEHRLGPMANNKSSGIRGVCWSKRERKWQVVVGHHGRQYWGGYYRDIGDAEAAAIALRNQLFTHNDIDREITRA